jgi:hypothetical protein
MTPFKRRETTRLTSAGCTEQLQILVTGSRRWTDRAMIRRALEREFECVASYVEASEITVVHGAQGVYENGYKHGKLICGADMMADEEAKALGMCTDPIAADWEGPCDANCHHGPRRMRSGVSYCQLAGFRRNQKLVDTQPDLALGFPLGHSPGTRDCLCRATAAGIPTSNVPGLIKLGLFV